MKRILIIIFICCFWHFFAAGFHIIGGEIYYHTIGKNANNKYYRYLITLKLYRDADFVCGEKLGCIDRFENPVSANVYSSNGEVILSDILLYIVRTRSLSDSLKNPCLAAQSQHLEVAFYTATIELPPRTGGYYVTVQRCCRGERLNNIYNSEKEGSTYYTVIPGKESRPDNNSAYFGKDTSIIICNAMPFKLDYAAYDEDGDSLTYHLCSALTDGSGNKDNTTVAFPPYNTAVNYMPPFSGRNPMGGNPAISISSAGLITGTPGKPGKYVVTICVDEYDPVTKKFLGTHSKDILFVVFDCQTPITANFPPVLKNCADNPELSVPFPNFSVCGFSSSFYWTFGDGTDTITHNKSLFYHHYADTGVYNIKLVINPALPCSDSVEAVVYNYPGLKAGFTMDGYCKDVLIQCNDTSTYRYGKITSYKWELDTGDSVITLGNARSLPYAFNKAGVYSMSLSLQTDKQCNIMITKNLRIYEVNPFAGNDTILAKGQIMSMQGSGGDFYSWSPAIGLSDPGIANPLLNFSHDITYTLRVSNQEGCFGYDTIRIKYYSGPDIYIPNAFTPNGDGLNDLFRFIPVGITSYKFFRIYNRWGVEIYSSNDCYAGWNGTYRGLPAPSGIYIWILQGKDFNSKEITKRGTVALIR